MPRSLQELIGYNNEIGLRQLSEEDPFTITPARVELVEHVAVEDWEPTQKVNFYDRADKLIGTAWVDMIFSMADIHYYLSGGKVHFDTAGEQIVAEITPIDTDRPDGIFQMSNVTLTVVDVWEPGQLIKFGITGRR